ncbi:MAG: ATP-binding protein [Nannocystaceae bacterium]
MDPHAAPRQLAANEFARALTAICVGSVAHTGLALLFLLAATGRHGAPIDQGPHAAIMLLVALGTLGQIVAAQLLHRRSEAPARRLIRWIPRIGRWTPALAGVPIVCLTFEPVLLVGENWAIAGRIAPTLAATLSSAVLITLLQTRVLHALAVHSRIRAPIPLLHNYDPPALSATFSTLLAWSCCAAGLLALSYLISSVGPDTSFVNTTRAAACVASFLGCVALAALAGSSIGQSPGRDVASIAQRLDAIGYNKEQRMGQEVVATSFDEVGALFDELERLRVRLAGELAHYDSALGRTRNTDAIKAEFLAAVSHELRTPLNSICGFAQLLLEGTPSQLSDPQREDVTLILTGGRQLLTLINDILDISLIESGELSLNFAREDLGELIDEIVNIHRSLVRDKSVVLVVESPPDLPRVVCDRRRITQVLTNLLSNAIKFTDTGKIELRVRVSSADPRLVVSVEDTGVGIAQGELASVFERYEQAGSLKHRTAGTGLGLAIARSIAEHHGGALEVESRLGHGSTFTLELPLEPPGRPSSIDMSREAERAAKRQACAPSSHVEAQSS